MSQGEPLLEQFHAETNRLLAFRLRAVFVLILIVDGTISHALIVAAFYLSRTCWEPEHNV